MLEPSKGKTKISGRYRVEQPIENFRIRVKIVQQKSLLAELFENEDETLDGNFLEDEEYEFAWQEKVLGPYEAKYYLDERNCVTEQQKDYHRRLLLANTSYDDTTATTRERQQQQQQQQQQQGSRLYSYVQGDAYYPDPNLTTGNYRTSLSMRNESALPALRNRKPFNERYNKKVVDDTPSDKRIRENHYLYTERQTMYIVADLSPKDDNALTTNDSEALLCAISYDRLRRCLTINPDFSTDDCYSVDGIGMSYDYWLGHASQKPTLRESQRYKDNVKKELHRLRSLKEAHLYHEILSPQPRVLRIYLSLDIGVVKNFDNDHGLFVTYKIDLPRNWRPAYDSDRRKLTGRTQRSIARDKRANLSYCADLLLDLDYGEIGPDHEVTILKNVKPPSWPTILFSVASLDNWTRYRIEGYGSLPLPTDAGSYVFDLKTWRPTGGPIDALRRVFTGGTCELDDITYCAVPSLHSGTLLDKACLNVVPSGNIELRLNLVHQCQSYVERRRRRGEADDDEEDGKINTPGQTGKLLNSVDDVLNQFKAARERMIQARALCGS